MLESAVLRVCTRKEHTPAEKNSPGTARHFRRPQGAQKASNHQTEGRLFMTDFEPAQRPQSCAFVIFGITGDLTHRLVIPSLYNLAVGELSPKPFCIVGVARHSISNDALRESLMKGLRQFATRSVDDKVANRLLECVTSVEADPGDPPSFDRLKERLEKLEADRNTGGNPYLATPPDAFAPIACQFGRVGVSKEGHGPWRRLVVEKPFGTDLASAHALNTELLQFSTSTRSTGSTTIWMRKRCRTS